MIKDTEYKPYVYVLRHLATGKLYVGSKTAKSTYVRANPQSLLCRYFTSSKTVKALIESEGIDSFVVSQIHECLNAENALNLEHLILRNIPSKQRHMYFNEKFESSDFKRVNSGKITINDGIKNRYIYPYEEIPEGWSKGRKIHPNTTKSLTRRVIFNGETFEAVKDLKEKLGVSLKTVYNMIERNQVQYA